MSSSRENFINFKFEFIRLFFIKEKKTASNKRTKHIAIGLKIREYHFRDIQHQILFFFNENVNKLIFMRKKKSDSNVSELVVGCHK